MRVILIREKRLQELVEKMLADVSKASGAHPSQAECKVDYRSVHYHAHALLRALQDEENL